MSKQYLLLLNNIVLLVILLIVFLGTLYPIVTEVFYEQKLSIGPDYFSNLISPLVFILIGLFLAEQFLSNLKTNKKNTLLLVGLFALIFLVLFITDLSPINLSLLFVSVVLVILLIRALIELAQTKDIKIMHKVLGHLSVVMLTLAVLANHQYSESIDVKLKPGDQVQFSGSTLKLNSINIKGKENFDSVVARFSVREATNEKSLISEKRVYKVGGVITSETGISTSIIKDYHIVLGDRYQDGSWSIRFSINYGIMMIWISSIILLLSMLYGTIRRHGY